MDISKSLISISICSMFVGFIASSLMLRFYFMQGGSKKWLYTLVQSLGWPICAGITIAISNHRKVRLQRPSLKLILVYAVLGSLTALDNLLFTWGMSYLPASTAGLLSASQLAFNAIFALIMVRQRISAYSWNAIVLVTSSSIILALHSSHDRLHGVSHHEYVIGFITTVAAAALYGFMLPLTQLVFSKIFHKNSPLLVLELQTYTAMFASFVALIGMAINGDFSSISHESHIFHSGPTGYYLTLICSAIGWQMAFLGSMGVIFLSSSLLAGVVLATIIPFGAIFAVIFFHDNFGPLKIMAMILSLWGFTSYIYGNYVQTKVLVTSENQGTNANILSHEDSGTKGISLVGVNV